MQETGGKIKVIEIEDEVKKSYLDYAMSVIVGRALPDVRDGLKPVHRRILYAMNDMGLLPNRPFKKSARIVGEVLGKYHPHGDMAVYDAMVRMAQDFSSRCELVDGHGNFGSVDGDAPAAMRYTEARLSQLAMELIRDIDKETIDFIPNFDESLKEPTVLPARFPNLLVNGSSGIAVGMATNIPPHNLGEIIDGTILAIDNPEVSLEEMMKVIKGPDFPTGGIIMGRAVIKEAYTTGRGAIKVRARVHIEDEDGKNRLVVEELPYIVNKARLAERIAELVRSKQISDISDLRDESDRSGMRLVLDLKKGAIPQIVLNNLYKHTQMEETFGIIMLAIVNGVPRVLPLLEIIKNYINYQVEIVTKRTRYELKKAQERAHILEGLLIALKNIDEVIALIKKSKTVDEARVNLVKTFKLTEIQAQAILDMRLQRLTGLERKKVEEEHKETIKRIAYLEEILRSERRVYEIIKQELIEIKEKFSDERRTSFIQAAEDFELEDLIAEEEIVVTITHSGYIKRLPLTTYRKQQRGGIGVAGIDLKEEDFVEHLYTGTTHSQFLVFGSRGKVFRLRAYDIPEGSRISKGQAIINLLALQSGENIAAVIEVEEFSPSLYLVMATKNGLIKKTALSKYGSSRRDGIVALNLKPEDELIKVIITDGEKDILLTTRKGQAIRFNEKNIRAIGRVASGVIGIRLSKDDEVISMTEVEEEAYLITVTANGYGKRTKFEKYRRQNRGGKGVKAIMLTKKKGYLVGAESVRGDEEIIFTTEGGKIIRLRAKDISKTGRATQGSRIMSLKENDRFSSFDIVPSETPENIKT